MQNQQFTINGVTYEADEIYRRTLKVHGVEPTDFEDYQYLNILVNHRNRNANAGGEAQAEYRCHNLEELQKWHAHQYPYLINVDMITATDKKGRQIQVVVRADYDSVQELELVPRKKVNNAASTAAPAKP